MNKTSIGVFALLALLTLAGCSSTSETDETTTSSIIGKTFKGNWDSSSGNPSTYKLLKGSQVRYCFRGDCTTEKYTGDPDKTVRFVWGDANFTFKRTGERTVKGYFRAGSSRSTVDMAY